MRKVLLLTAAILILSINAMAADTPAYDKNLLRLPGQLLSVAVEDIDGDGDNDIVAFSNNADKRYPGRSISVFYARRGGSFPQSADQSFTLAPDAAVFDIGDASGSGKKSICYIGPNGVFAYNLSGRSFSTRPVQLIRSENIFSQQDQSSLPRWNFIMNASGEQPTILVPEVNRLLVYAGGSGGFRQTGSIPFATRSAFTESIISGDAGPLTISHRLPLVSAVGFNSRPEKDLFITWDDNADVFLKKSGGFAEAPALRFRPGLTDGAKTDLIENTSVQAEDLNGEGRSDLIVTKMTGGVAQTKTLVFIYMRKKDGSFPDKPSQTIITEGVIGPCVLDINSDGRKDIILPSVKMGINNFINMLTSRQINMNIGIYLQDRNGRFPDRPTKEKSVSFKLDISNMGKNVKPVMAFGRFTKAAGYGLAVASKEESVSLFMPDRYSILGDNAALTLSVNAPSEIDAVDINRDGIDDLIMSYRKVKDRSWQIYVFVSKT